VEVEVEAEVEAVARTRISFPLSLATAQEAAIAEAFTSEGAARLRLIGLSATLQESRICGLVDEDLEARISFMFRSRPRIGLAGKKIRSRGVRKTVRYEMNRARGFVTVLGFSEAFKDLGLVGKG
jgi:hypothetical protein